MTRSPSPRKRLTIFVFGEPELDLLRRGFAFDDHALGQRRLVDRQRVLALLGHVETPFAVGIRHGLGFEAAALDGHGHVWHRLVLERDDAGEVEVRLLLVVARSSACAAAWAPSERPCAAAEQHSERERPATRRVRRAVAVVGPTEPPVRHRRHRSSGRIGRDERRYERNVSFVFRLQQRFDAVIESQAATPACGIRSAVFARGMNSQAPTLRIEYGAFSRTGRRRPHSSNAPRAQENPWSTRPLRLRRTDVRRRPAAARAHGRHPERGRHVVARDAPHHRRDAAASRAPWTP